MNWEDIQGWFDFGSIYAEQVRRAGDGARFVEVGAWKGKSTAFMAQRIRESCKRIDFYAVDTWKGSADDAENELAAASLVTGDLYVEFLRNMRECGVSDYVTPILCDSVAAASGFVDESIDFVFIDGDHREEAVLADLRAWWPKVKPGGLIAGHDWWQDGPKAAVQRFTTQVGHAVYGDGSASEEGYRSWCIPKPIAEPVKILLALPGYDGATNAKTMMMACRQNYSGPGEVLLQHQYTSLLAANFNSLWCMALNDPSYTHFAMLHADIVPTAYWLDVLMHELVAEKAQIVSTIVPIKDDCGVTSTGVANPESKWAPKRRFTMYEVMTMPGTFGPELTAYKDHKLVLNTGCWLADLRDPRWKTTDANGELVCHFEINDRIVWTGDMWLPQCQPEDFNFSVQAQSLGMRCLATRKVQVDHMGNMRFPNNSPWGKWKVDEATKTTWEG